MKKSLILLSIILLLFTYCTPVELNYSTNEPIPPETDKPVLPKQKNDYDK